MNTQTAPLADIAGEHTALPFDPQNHNGLASDSDRPKGTRTLHDDTGTLEYARLEGGRDGDYSWFRLTTRWGTAECSPIGRKARSWTVEYADPKSAEVDPILQAKFLALSHLELLPVPWTHC